MADPEAVILNVDDNEASRYVRARVLRMAGFAVYDAASGAEAIEAAAARRPDLVLLDVNLPDMSGLDVCRILKSDPNLGGLSVMHLSASSIHTEDQVAGLAAADAYLTEPIDPDVLLATVRAILRARRAERERAVFEQRYRKLYDANIVGLVTTDDNRILEANDAFLGMIGRTREELLSGSIGWKSITSPEFRSSGGQTLSELWRRGTAGPSEEELVRPDGTRLPVLLGATVLDREPVRWLGFVVDLTERKRLEQQLRNAHKLESIGLLAGGVAHDFNNLLTSIMGNVGLAMEELEPAHSCRDMLQEALLASQRAADLTRQLLAYAGKGCYALERLDLSRIVRETSRLVEASVPKGIRLEFNLASELPAVEADAGQLQQVLMNLVTNGFEAVGNQNGAIIISTGTEEIGQPWADDSGGADKIGPGLYVWLEVRDPGCGMSEDIRLRLFDPFFTTKFLGRGLGLAAVAGIVRAHKGGIRVVSTPLEGSSFRILLPACERIADRPVRPAKRKAILVVDDEELVRDVTRSALEQFGYTVLLAGDGPSAVEIFRRMPDRISLVILDMAMPVMGGEETLRLLRGIQPALKVIVCSGYGHAETVARFAGQPIEAFLGKPFTPAQLAAKVKDVFGG